MRKELGIYVADPTNPIPHEFAETSLQDSLLVFREAPVLCAVPLA